jgi:hypothetical protein
MQSAAERLALAAAGEKQAGKRGLAKAEKKAEKRARCEAAVPPARPDCPIGRAEGGARRRSREVGLC